jgi:uncharacterized protein YegL
MKKTVKHKQTSNAEQTLVVFLLDRTGSMASVKQETIGGFNGYLDELLKKPESENIRFHFVQFDTVSTDTVHDRVKLSEVAKLTDKTYEPRGGTNLYDAIGSTIRATQDKVNGDKVLFVTLTDGEENSSSEWNQSTIKALIKEKEDKDKWTFSYIGVGPEAWAANERLAAGTIGASNVLRATRGKNTQKAYSHLADATMIRCSTAGGQSLSAVYHNAQLDKDEE